MKGIGAQGLGFKVLGLSFGFWVVKSTRDLGRIKSTRQPIYRNPSPLPSMQEPSYVHTVFPTVEALKYPIPGYASNPFEVRCVVRGFRVSDFGGVGRILGIKEETFDF